MNHNLPKNGHAPGCLRDGFLELLYSDDNELTEEEIYGERRSFRWLCGKLWNCTDIMPSCDCNTVELPFGSTYAKAARKLISEDNLVSALKAANKDQVQDA